jgi:D-alanine-D-alanine ligase
MADPTPSLTIGIVYETFSTYPRSVSDPHDAHAEYEPESTVRALEAAIGRLGHRPLRLGSPHDVLGLLAAGKALGVDAALNIAEGYGSRNREAWAPVLLEMAGVPCLGSDALTLSMSLDKPWTNRAVAAAGVPVAPACVLESATAAERLDLDAHGLAFPLFVKPRWEGSAKGILQTSRVEDPAALVREVRRVVEAYGEPALVECFLPGAEYTVALVGNDPPRVLPVLQRALDAESAIGVHVLEAQGQEVAAREHSLPGELSAELEARLGELALRVWDALECRDFARCDFRLDAGGEPVFLEINPLPTFAVDGTFAILAELEGRPFEDLLADVLARGLRRLGLSERATTSERVVSG